jgi:geranylgeranyl diphosphate synthase, type II
LKVKESDQNLSVAYTKVPQCRLRRDIFERSVAKYVRDNRLVPPLTEQEILQHALCLQPLLDAVSDEIIYISLLLNNQLWLETIRRIPYERRLLLLPQCLSDPDVCRAERDAIGLLCAQCGGCAIGTLQSEAEKLGYITLVAEGTTVVSNLLSSGKVDSVIGIGCIDSLQRIFPVMSEHAIPGQGIALLFDGCRRTQVDLEWALRVIREYTPLPGHTTVNLERVAATAREWFNPVNLASILHPPITETARIGQEWMVTGGKRWRPILTSAVFAAAGGELEQIMQAAVAVECFHKASLIHDDIEDNDEKRYDQPTVHMQYGIPAAINAGDYLIGEGYRLLASSGFSGETCAQMVKAAAEGHRELCLGQGEELAFSRTPLPVTEPEVLSIYRRKTGAAFEVAVLTGALAAELDNETCATLSDFSDAIGTAYQIQDDIDDFRSAPGRAADMLTLRPTLFLAMACMSDHPLIQNALKQSWHKDHMQQRLTLIKAIEKAGLHKRVELLYAHYRLEAERILANISHIELKRLLRNIITHMLTF